MQRACTSRAFPPTSVSPYLTTLYDMLDLRPASASWRDPSTTVVGLLWDATDTTLTGRRSRSVAAALGEVDPRRG